jgi:hypothetical protein
MGNQGISSSLSWLMTTQPHLAGIHRMTGLLTRECCRTMAFARPSPRQERQHDPKAGNIGEVIIAAILIDRDDRGAGSPSTKQENKAKLA